MADTQNDLWISIVAESDMPEDDAPLNLAAAKELVRAHNESDTAHADIRAQLQTIADKQIEEIKEYATKRDFPASGDTSVTIYIDVSTGNLYRYNTSARKYEALAMDTIPDSIALEGRPTAPTASIGTNTTQVATTAFVQNELAALREQSESVTPVYYDGRTKAKLSLLGENGTIVTNVANGKVEQGSSDAITGDQLWSAQQDMTNMSALAARNIAANAAEIDLLKRAQSPWENLTDENKDTLTSLIRIVADEGLSVEDAIDENHVKEFTISLDPVSGSVSANETKPVAGGTVYTAIQNAVSDINTALEDKVSKEELEDAALSNQLRIINGDHTAAMLGEADGKPVYSINVRANGLIQRNDGRLITGGTVYAETRLEENGSIISSNNTAAQNLKALDTALSNIQSSIGNIPDVSELNETVEGLETGLANLNEKVDNKVNADLSNLTEAGTNVIRQLVSTDTGSTYQAGEYIKISDDNVISVKVTGNVQDGSVGIVTGDKIARAITSSEVRTGTIIQQVHDELTHRIENLEDGNSESAYTLVKNDETNQLILLNGDEVVSRIQLATDTDTKYSLEKSGNTLRLIPNDDPTQAISIELDQDVNTTYTLALENNQLIFTPSDHSDPTVINLPDAVTHSELANYVQVSELENYVQDSDLVNYVQTDVLENYVQNDVLNNYVKQEDLESYVTNQELTTALEENNAELENLQTEIAEKANADTVYTKDEVASFLAAKVETDVILDNGTESRIFNSATGAEIKYSDSEQKTESYISVNDDIQLSAKDTDSDTGSYVIINPSGVYYTTSENGEVSPEDEIVAKRDLVSYDERITAIENATIDNILYTAGDGIAISEDNIISVDNRTIYKITSENGNESLIFNEATGGGARYKNVSRDSDSFVGVNDGSDNIDVMIYAIDMTSNIGSRINVNQNGAYYTVSNSSVFTDDDEIATRKDIEEAANVDVYDSIDMFPEEGNAGRLYIDAETNIPYRWDSELEDYVPVSGNSNIDSLTDEEIDSLF